jgi:hypothetical protein
MTDKDMDALTHLTERERQILKRAEKETAYVGYEAQGTGLHNDYLGDVPYLVKTIDKLRAELEEARAVETTASAHLAEADNIILCAWYQFLFPSDDSGDEWPWAGGLPVRGLIESYLRKREIIPADMPSEE